MRYNYDLKVLLPRYFQYKTSVHRKLWELFNIFKLKFVDLFGDLKALYSINIKIY